MATVKLLSQKQLALKFKPYAAELGNVVYAWNRLQEAFALVLWWTMEKPSNNVVGAIWHSIPSDSQQRKTLRAAIEATPSRTWQGQEYAENDFLWALSVADELAVRRNNAIHSPYFMMVDAEGARLSPNVGLGNKRAKNLMGKELLKEFSDCAEDANLLWKFTVSVYEVLLWPERPWPDRPLRLVSAPYGNPKKLRR